MRLEVGGGYVQTSTMTDPGSSRFAAPVRGVDRAEFDDAREFRGHAFDLLARAQQFLVDRRSPRAVDRHR